MKSNASKTSRKSTKATSTRKTSKAQKAAVARHRIDPQLHIVSKVEGNPRRKGSHGFKSFQIIASARKPVSVETFVEKGGRLRDLHWDINAGNAKLVKKAG
jgi:hypothetical protein